MKFEKIKRSLQNHKRLLLSGLFCFGSFINTDDVSFDVSMLRIYWG